MHVMGSASVANASTMVAILTVGSMTQGQVASGEEKEVPTCSSSGPGGPATSKPPAVSLIR